MTVTLSLTDAEGQPREPDTTFPASLAVHYAYPDHVDLPDGTPRTGQAAHLANASYPGVYRLAPSFPVPGEVTVWVEAGRGGSQEIDLTLGEDRGHPIPSTGLAGVLAAALAARSHARLGQR